MADALRLEVKKDSWKQNQDGTYKLSLTLNPTDLDDNAQNLLVEFIKAPMGTRYYVGMAEIGDDEQPVVKRAPAAPKEDKVPFRDRKLAWQAGVRCNDEGFQRFMREVHGYTNENAEQTAGSVRLHCGVDSRAEFNTSHFLGVRWEALNAEFEEWAGLTAEAR